MVSEINFLMDFVKILDDDNDMQPRMILTNIEVAANYISKEWELAQPSKEKGLNEVS